MVIDEKTFLQPIEKKHDEEEALSKKLETARIKKEDRYLEMIRKYLAMPKVTDIHITEGKYLALRLDGKIMETNVMIPERGIDRITNEIFHLQGWGRSNASGEYNGFRVRLRQSQSLQRKQLFIRVLPQRAPDIYKLGYGEIIQDELLAHGKALNPGIVIVAGATGSGKSTLLAAVLQYILDKFPIHVVSAEDPVEYLLYDMESEGGGVVSQRELPDDCPTFEDAVANAMREDPDVILIGEMRTAPTAEATLQAAETGHLVFTTIHAANIPGIISRLLGLLKNTVDAEARLAQALRGCVYLSLKQNEKGEFERRADFLWFNDECRRLVREGKFYELSGKVNSYIIQNFAGAKFTRASATLPEEHTN